MTIFVNLKDIIGFAILALICLVVAVILARHAWKQHRCKHTSFHETRSCDAVCNDCGKNLGFIGRLRDAAKNVS